MWLGQLGQAYAMAGDTARARASLTTFEERERTSHVSPYHIACVHAGLGDADRAMDLLEHAVAERAWPAYNLKGAFLFSALHSHPRFRALLREMKLD